jgi:hypothetical protein
MDGALRMKNLCFILSTKYALKNTNDVSTRTKNIKVELSDCVVTLNFIVGLKNDI